VLTFELNRWQDAAQTAKFVCFRAFKALFFGGSAPENLRRGLFRGERHSQDRRWVAGLPTAIKSEVRAFPQGLQYVPGRLWRGWHPHRHDCRTLTYCDSSQPFWHFRAAVLNHPAYAATFRAPPSPGPNHARSLSELPRRM
jgi:hypothetical protein